MNICDNSNQLSFFKYSQAWKIPEDLSSLSSLSSESSLAEISQLDKIEDVVMAWMMRTGEKETRTGARKIGWQKDRTERSQNAVETNRISYLKRNPFSYISQNREIINQTNASYTQNIPLSQHLRKTVKKPENIKVKYKITLSVYRNHKSLSLGS